jgi:hypothetical protein
MTAMFAALVVLLPCKAQTDGTGYRVYASAGTWVQSSATAHDQATPLQDGNFLPENAQIRLVNGKESDSLTLLSLRDASIRKIACTGAQFYTCRQSVVLDASSSKDGFSLMAAIKPYLNGMFILLGHKSPDLPRPMIEQLSRGESQDATPVEEVIPQQQDTSTLFTRLLPGLPDGDYSVLILHGTADAETRVFQIVQGRSSTALPLEHAGFYLLRLYGDHENQIASISLLVAPPDQAAALRQIIVDTQSRLKSSNVLGSNAQNHAFLSALLREMGRQSATAPSGDGPHVE